MTAQQQGWWSSTKGRTPMPPYRRWSSAGGLSLPWGRACLSGAPKPSTYIGAVRGCCSTGGSHSSSMGGPLLGSSSTCGGWQSSRQRMATSLRTLGAATHRKRLQMLGARCARRLYSSELPSGIGSGPSSRVGGSLPSTNAAFVLPWLDCQQLTPADLSVLTSF